MTLLHSDLEIKDEVGEFLHKLIDRDSAGGKFYLPLK